MERPNTITSAISDVVMIVMLVTLGVFVAVAPAAVIAGGVPAMVVYRLVTRTSRSAPPAEGSSADLNPQITVHAYTRDFGRDVHAA